MKYLLDTNICVFVIRQKSRSISEKFAQFQPDELVISAVTLAELRYGADKSSNPNKNHAALNMFLVPFALMDFDVECAEIYGIVRTQLERSGTPIGPLDTMIAAHALRLKLPLVANNVREFERVAGLVLEDWTR